MRLIKEIIIHCSDTPAGRDDSVKDIDRWHKARGWSRVGYHFVIRLDGTIEKGREEEVIGAHCKGHNSNSIGVCYIGGKGGDTRTDAQKKSLKVLVEYLKLSYPQAKVYGHYDFSSKTCPNFNVDELR